MYVDYICRAIGGEGMDLMMNGESMGQDLDYGLPLELQRYPLIKGHSDSN